MTKTKKKLYNSAIFFQKYHNLRINLASTMGSVIFGYFNYVNVYKKCCFCIGIPSFSRTFGQPVSL